MADIVTLTPQPIRVTTAGGNPQWQPIYLATDIGGYDILDVEGGVIANEGSVSAFTLDIYTSMQNQTDDGWIKVGRDSTPENWAT